MGGVVYQTKENFTGPRQFRAFNGQPPFSLGLVQSNNGARQKFFKNTPYKNHCLRKSETESHTAAPPVALEAGYARSGDCM